MAEFHPSSPSSEASFEIGETDETVHGLRRLNPFRPGARGLYSQVSDFFRSQNLRAAGIEAGLRDARCEKNELCLPSRMEMNRIR